MPRVLAEGRWLRLIDDGGWEYAERTGSRGVAVIVAVTDAAELLLVEQYRHAVKARVIEPPAGLVGDLAGHADEDASAAARRELREETGIEAAVTALLDVVDSITRDDGGAIAYHYTLVDFLAEWCDGAVRAGGDAAEAVWADPDDLGPFDLWDETLRVIRLGLAKRSLV